MPTISRIRLTNVVYENNAKRYNDQIFRFDGENGIFLLENGGGKTVFLQTVLQAVIPHINMADRKIKETLVLDGSPAHIAIEWILNEKPRRYGITAVSLYMENNELNSYKYVYNHGPEDKNSIEAIPFVVENKNFKNRPASKGEISDYYSRMKQQYMHAETFNSIKDYHKYIEEEFKIIPYEWRQIADINGTEGGIDAFFKNCKNTEQLINNLLIPIVEDALEGSEKIDFVQTFEKQREHFKQNKWLTEQIEEFRTIKNQVDVYVSDYDKFDQSIKAYNVVKEEAKALNKYVVEALEDNKEEQVKLNQDYELYTNDLENYKRKKASLEIAVLDQQIEVYKSEKNELNKHLSDNDQQLNNMLMKIQNIEITNLEQKNSTLVQQIGSLENQLQELQQSEEERELREKVEETKAFIHGYYLNTLEALNRKKDRISLQLGREKDELEVLKGKKENKNSEISEVNGDIKGKEASLDALIKSMEKIKNKMYEPINEENAQSLSRKFKERAAAIEDELGQLRKEKEGNKELQRQINEKKIELMNAISLVSAEKTECQTKLSEANKQQDQIIAALESYFANLNIYDSIYTKEPTIRQMLDDRLKKRQEELEECLVKERVNTRLVDMYGDIPYFVADTTVAKRLNKIMNQVSYAEHGSVYVQKNIKALGGNIKDLYKQYPYWANSVVTIEADRPKVFEYMESLKAELSFPVYILTTGDVESIVKDGFKESQSIQSVFPDSWADNLNQENFDNWKDAIRQEAEQVKALRINAGNRLKDIENLKRRTEDYFNRYSYDTYRTLESLIEQAVTKEKVYEEERLNIYKDNDRLLEQMERIEKRKDELLEEQPQVTDKVNLTIEFLKNIKEKKVVNVSLEEGNRLVVRLRTEYDRLGSEIKRQEDIVSEITKDEASAIANINSKKVEDLFFEVKDTQAKYSDLAIEVLKTKLNNENLQLNKVTGLSKGVESQLKEVRKNQIEILEQLSIKKRNARYDIEEVISYDKSELERLYDKSRSVEEVVNELRPKHEESIRKLSEKVGRRNTKYEPFEDKGWALEIFEQELSQAKQQLKEEKKNIADKEKELKRNKEKNEKYIKMYNDAKQALEILGAEHGYSAMVINDYNTEDYINFEYEYQKVLRSTKDHLEVKRTEYNRKKQDIDEKKKEYLRFCNELITEPRLKESAIKGIERNRNYKELLEYQNNMKEILEKNIRIAEEDRRESDAELQTFLSHIMTYSRNVINEIDAIQHKTKIKVDDKPKQIFIFNIPVYDEHDAKEALRRYINQLVVDYDKENDNLHEDKEAAREFIEKKLSVKNLIMQILGDKRIKIKCRKVTNDLKIGQAPMSWEHSNKWSGGEKWSKNMTLFLSLLNYIAEKKQFLSASQKRHRTVVLDNPFGKASSKHVLDPVFFVADNLGFQVITVTAHAEGQFVTDYFPVVYSGKLRVSNDPDKQIMDITKTLNTAYFKSESPDTLMRFEESEQMSFLV